MIKQLSYVSVLICLVFCLVCHALAINRLGLVRLMALQITRGIGARRSVGLYICIFSNIHSLRYYVLPTVDLYISHAGYHQLHLLGLGPSFTSLVFLLAYFSRSSSGLSFYVLFALFVRFSLRWNLFGVLVLVLPLVQLDVLFMVFSNHYIFSLFLVLAVLGPNRLSSTSVSHILRSLGSFHIPELSL